MRLGTKSILSRFWNKINILGDNDCWVWLACCDAQGYGRFRFNEENNKASRVMWIITQGKIPKNKHVLHKCDNPKCVNPNHLFLGTHADNMKDMKQKNRQGNHNLHGEDFPQHKISSSRVNQLKEAHAKAKKDSSGRLWPGEKQRLLTQFSEIKSSQFHNIVTNKQRTIS